MFGSLQSVVVCGGVTRASALAQITVASCANIHKNEYFLHITLRDRKTFLSKSEVIFDDLFLKNR